SRYLSVLLEHASNTVLEGAGFLFPRARNVPEPNLPRDFFGRVCVVVVRGSERPAQSGFVGNELVDENPPAEIGRQLTLDHALAGEIFDFCRPCRAQAEIALRMLAEECAIRFARPGVDPLTELLVGQCVEEAGHVRLQSDCNARFVEIALRSLSPPALRNPRRSRIGLSIAGVDAFRKRTHASSCACCCPRSGPAWSSALRR